MIARPGEEGSRLAVGVDPAEDVHGRTSDHCAAALRVPKVPFPRSSHAGLQTAIQCDGASPSSSLRGVCGFRECFFIARTELMMDLVMHAGGDHVSD